MSLPVQTPADSSAADVELVARQGGELSQLSAEALVGWAGQHFGSSLALTASFGGASGMVLLDLVVRHAPRTSVVLIDTGVLFPETYQTLDAVQKHYGIEVRRVTPVLTLQQQAEVHGERLWERDPDACCRMRKVEPLAAGLRGYRAWLTALRRDQSDTRAQTPVVSWNARHNLVKLCPLANWSEEEVWAYIHANGVPFNPLLGQGYTSIGCHTCTRKPVDGDPRSGRWVNFTKKECGLHL
jgi:phosphoadenosine phosphosulfate reductase